MAYQLPDVFVTVTFPDIVPTIETPTLLPCMVGEHYVVEKDKFLVNNAAVTTGAPVDFLYPGIPKSYNKVSDTLLVDVLSGSAYKPTAYLVTQDGGTVDVTSNLTFTASLVQVPVGMAAGAIYVSYRYRSDRYSGKNLALLKASSISDLIALFGADSLSPANPLGYAMYQAMIHGGVSVGGCAIGSPPSEVGAGVYSATLNTTLCYAYVADFLKGEDIHSVTLLTTAVSVMNLFRNHVRDMSSELGKSERRLFFTPPFDGVTRWPVRQENPKGVWRRFTVATGNPGTGTHTVAILALGQGGVYDFGGYPVIKSADGIYMNGPIFDITVDGEEFTIDETKQLIELYNSAVSPAATQIRLTDLVEVYDRTSEGLKTISISKIGFNGKDNWVAVTNANQYAYGYSDTVDSESFSILRSLSVYAKNTWMAGLKQFPRSYADERLVIVAPDYVYDPDVAADVPSYFAAAKLAGEISRVGVAPAGASPGVDPLGFEDSKVKKFYSSRYFSEEEMRELGGSGWTMLVNSAKGQQLNTQHTVTTNMTSPEYYELILGVERDFLARFYRNELRQMLRRFRIDDATLSDVSIRCGTIANALYSVDSVSRCFRDVRVISVTQNPLQRDQVLINLEVTHLYPLNTIKVRVQVVA